MQLQDKSDLPTHAVLPYSTLTTSLKQGNGLLLGHITFLGPTLHRDSILNLYLRVEQKSRFLQQKQQITLHQKITETRVKHTEKNLNK